MIPKGNMMASTLNKVDTESYELIEFRCSNKKETPEENKGLEEEFKLLTRIKADEYDYFTKGSICFKFP